MVDQFTALLWLFALDALFVGLVVLAIIPLGIYRRAAFAVLKRNFVGYFSNPTGYVFLCVFVTLSSLAAFVPHEFFNANLANLDQLNKWIPYIMLVFIPAITMSIWSDERRQGTDELLLTLPASDFDIVIGKYLAAAAIFSASLVFSQLASFAVLVALTEGTLDTGLLYSTYFGYWLMGLSMLSVGMVASFLTNNLTVGFIFGAFFNAPLVLLEWADTVIPRGEIAHQLSRWSISQQFADFGRGVISISSISYFVMLIAVGLYLSMVLIGRRHWWGGRDGHSLLGHYMVRTLALVLLVGGISYTLSNHDFIRSDVTLGQVSSLSPDTIALVKKLKADEGNTVYIDAYVSREVPEVYVPTKLNLTSMLTELEKKADGMVVVRRHYDLETFSQEAALAEERFGIEAQSVQVRSRGQFRDTDVILGAAFTCGLEMVVVPFFDYGVPVEYELIRSINTVARKQRGKVGVVRTDAQMFGGFSFAGGMPQQIPKHAMIEELEKQYDVEEVDPNSPILPDTHDVLLVVQPSSLSPEELDNVVDAIRDGQPTAIFEDPSPTFSRGVPGTGDPKQSPGGMFGGGGGPLPKGDIQKLWDVLQIDVPGRPGAMGLQQPDLVWQKYNPYPKLQLQGIPDEWVFASNDAIGGDGAINPDDDITSGLYEIFFPFPGTLDKRRGSELTFTPLVSTGTFSGTISQDDFRASQTDMALLRAQQGEPRNEQLVLAARIQSPAIAKAQDGDATTNEKKVKDKDGEKADEATEDENEEEEKQDDAANGNNQATTPKGINAVYVADIDLMIPEFLRIRNRPDESIENIQWNFENVTFVLNIIDALSGDDEYLPIRKRKPSHSTLRTVERRIQEARRDEFEQQLKFRSDFDSEIKDAEAENEKAIKEFDDELKKLEKQRQEQGGSDLELIQRIIALQQSLEERRAALSRRLAITREKMERKRDNDVLHIRRETDLEIRRIQNSYKVWSVLLPPIPPLLVGFVVWVRRRLREREGIARSRLK